MTDELSDRDEAVGEWMRELASLPLHGKPLADARLLWFKAELLKRWDAQRQAAEPIERAEPVGVGIGLAGVVFLLGWLWQHGPTPNITLIIATALTLMLVVTIAAVMLRQS